VGSLHRAAFENCLHWIELWRDTRRKPEGSTERAGDFMKAPSALCGAFDDPGDSRRIHRRRLGSGIGAGDRQASLVCFGAEALGHVAGYCLMNDYSERAFQIERGGQWVKGKSCDTFLRSDRFWRRPMRFETRTILRWG